MWGLLVEPFDVSGLGALSALLLASSLPQVPAKAALEKFRISDSTMRKSLIQGKRD